MINLKNMGLFHGWMDGWTDGHTLMIEKLCFYHWYAFP